MINVLPYAIKFAVDQQQHANLKSIHQHSYKKILAHFIQSL
jgi:hypothetical protein